MNKIKKAIDRGDTARLARMLEQEPGLASFPISWGGFCSSCQTEPLHYLSDGPFNRLWDHGRQAEMAQILIDAGAPVDGLPSSGETPLHGAASLGEAGVAEVLINNGADSEKIASYPGIPDGTPLDFAVHFGMTDVIKVLVEGGAKVLSTRIAAGVGDFEKVESEIKDLRADSDEMLDVFRSAVICDQTEIVGHIISKKLNVNSPIQTATALHWAAWEAKPRMVRFLINHGADWGVRDRKYDMTPKGWAKHRLQEVGPRWGHKEVIEILTSAQE